MNLLVHRRCAGLEMLVLSRFLHALIHWQWHELESELLTVALPDGMASGVVGIIYVTVAFVDDVAV